MDEMTPESSKALEARVAALKMKTDNSSNVSLFADERSKANQHQTEPCRQLMVMAVKRKQSAKRAEKCH